MTELSERIARLEARLAELAPEFVWTGELYGNFESITLYAKTRGKYGASAREVVIHLDMGVDLVDADSELVPKFAEHARKELQRFLEDNCLTE